MSTRSSPEKPAPLRKPGRDPAEQVAFVAHARRELLLKIHRYRLQRDDLEDCYSQATLELLQRARHRGGFSSQRHIANALEQRFLSRVLDRRRAISGRSPMQAALEGALASGGIPDELADGGPAVEELVLLRFDLSRLGRLIQELTPDQQLVLQAQASGIDCAGLCAAVGWSPEKYRKVAQRGRRKLRALSAERPDVPER